MFNKPTKAEDKISEEAPSSPTFGPAPIKAVPKTEEQAIKHTGTVGKSQYQFMKMSNSVPEPTSTIPVTLEELSAHVSEDDAWTSLGGVVYDVTKYLKHHPGGKQKLLSGCGIPCDELFNKYHPWVSGKGLLQKFKVGNLSSSE